MWRWPGTKICNSTVREVYGENSINWKTDTNVHDRERNTYEPKRKNRIFAIAVGTFFSDVSVSFLRETIPHNFIEYNAVKEAVNTRSQSHRRHRIQGLLTDIRMASVRPKYYWKITFYFYLKFYFSYFTWLIFLFWIYILLVFITGRDVSRSLRAITCMSSTTFVCCLRSFTHLLRSNRNACFCKERNDGTVLWSWFVFVWAHIP